MGSGGSFAGGPPPQMTHVHGNHRHQDDPAQPLKPLAMGQEVTPEGLTQISATVRTEKRKVPQEIEQQYTSE